MFTRLASEGVGVVIVTLLYPRLDEGIWRSMRIRRIFYYKQFKIRASSLTAPQALLNEEVES